MKNIICVMFMFYSGLIYAGDFEAGVEQFDLGNYEQAIAYFDSCKNTNIYCIHNIGVSHLKLNNKVEAKKWFTLASRYGSKRSVIALKENGWAIPKIDSPKANSTSRLRKNDSDGRYKSSMGNEYEYDLSNPSDQIRYEVDPSAQLRDEMDIDPRKEIERDLGEYGGGKVKRKY